MGRKHTKTYQDILAKPDKNDIPWDDFILLLEYLGARFKKGSGSATGVNLNGCYAVFHRPHPGNTIYQSDLKRIRRFLVNAGIQEVK
jgi:hypothetical protein